MPNNKTILVFIRNRSTFTSTVFINFLINGQVITAKTPAITPNKDYKGHFPKQATDLHMIFRNDSAPDQPIFDEQVRPHAMDSCFLLTGDSNYPICIPFPCNSLNSCNNWCNCCNCRYF